VEINTRPTRKKYHKADVFFQQEKFHKNEVIRPWKTIGRVPASIESITGTISRIHDANEKSNAQVASGWVRVAVQEIEIQ